MATTKQRFTYKCANGHVTEKVFPLGTRFDDYDETTCLECLNGSKVKPTYLVFAEAVSAGAK
jgi:hypothetical protein